MAEGEEFMKPKPYMWIAAVVVVAIVFFSIGYLVHTPPATTTPGGTSSGGNVTITFYESLGQSEASYFQNYIVPQFEQNYTNITVAFANLPSGNVPTEIQTLVQSNKVGATIVGLDNLAVGTVIYNNKGNLLMNLTNIAGTMEPSSMIPSAVNMTNYEKTVFGGIYFLPFRSNVPLVFYNKTAMTASGISAAPTTYAQLLTDAQAMNSHGFNGSVMIQGAGPNFEGGADTGTQLYQTMVQFGGNPFVLNSTADLQTFEYLYNLSPYLNPDYKTGYWGSYAGLAQNGSYKFLDYQWPYVYPLLTNETYKMNNTTLGVYGGPAGPANSNHLLGGDVLVIPKGATNLYALETFAKYLLGTHVQKETLLNLSWVAVNSGAYLNLPSSFSAVGSALQKAVNGGVFLRNPTPWIGQWNVYASTALQKVLALSSYSATGIASILNTYNQDMYTYLVNNYGQSVANTYENGGYQPISV